jgi:predicted kinase
MLLLVVGLPGSGKTTLAHTLAAQHGAVRLNPDEWMIDLCRRFNEQFRGRLEQRMISLATSCWPTRGAAIIEFRLWSRRERTQLLMLGRAAGAYVEMHVPEPDVEELWRRLSTRNVQPGETAIDRLTLESSLALWESPDESELSSYDACHRIR